MQLPSATHHEMKVSRSELHIHEHLPLPHSDRDYESCEVSERQNKASSKRRILCPCRIKSLDGVQPDCANLIIKDILTKLW